MAPEVPGVPSRVFYTRMQRENAQQAMRSMHDHIAATFPDLCPMHGPGRMGEPPSHARPVPVGVGGPVPHGATKAAEPVSPADEFEQSEAAARAARKAARKQQRELLDAIIKGEVSVEDARARLGVEPPAAPVTKAAAPEVIQPVTVSVDPDVLKSAFAESPPRSWSASTPSRSFSTPWPTSLTPGSPPTAASPSTRPQPPRRGC